MQARQRVGVIRAKRRQAAKGPPINMMFTCASRQRHRPDTSCTRCYAGLPRNDASFASTFPAEQQDLKIRFPEAVQFVCDNFF
jgi:hypothetical protein